MLKQFALCVFLVFISNKISGQYIVDRQCPTNIKAYQNFDAEKYLGKWYEIQRYDQPYEKDGDCCSAIYSWNDEKTAIKVQNCYALLPNVTQGCAIGTGVISYPDHVPLEGKLNVTFFGPPNKSNYWILDTDYVNFAIIYGCKNINEQKSAESAWILSRTAQLNPEVTNKVNENIDKYFNKNELRVTKQNDECKY